jgi:hypothetical protein
MKGHRRVLVMRQQNFTSFAPSWGARENVRKNAHFSVGGVTRSHFAQQLGIFYGIKIIAYRLDVWATILFKNF